MTVILPVANDWWRVSLPANPLWAMYLFAYFSGLLQPTGQCSAFLPRSRHGLCSVVLYLFSYFVPS